MEIDGVVHMTTISWVVTDYFLIKGKNIKTNKKIFGYGWSLI